MTRTDLQSILHEETTFALYHLHRKHFESGDTEGKMLASHQEQQENKQSIPAIRDCSGNTITEQALMGSTFKKSIILNYIRLNVNLRSTRGRNSLQISPSLN